MAGDDNAAAVAVDAAASLSGPTGAGVSKRAARTVGRIGESAASFPLDKPMDWLRSSRALPPCFLSALAWLRPDCCIHRDTDSCGSAAGELRRFENNHAVA